MYKRPLSETFNDLIEINESGEIRTLKENVFFKKTKSFQLIIVDENEKKIAEHSFWKLFAEAHIDNPNNYERVVFTPGFNHLSQICVEMLEWVAEDHNKEDYSKYPEIGEDWEELEGYEGVHEIASNGRIVMLPKEGGRNQKIKEIPVKSGKVRLYNKKSAKYETQSVALVVGNHFHERSSKSDQINFIDGDKENYHPSNLEWINFKQSRAGVNGMKKAIHHILEGIYGNKFKGFGEFEKIYKRELDLIEWENRVTK